MIKQEKYIEFIISELRKGNVSFNKVFELNLTKYNLARPTFAKYWKIANEAYKPELDKANEIKEKESFEAAKSQAKKEILTKDEALEILSKIAKGTARQIKTDSGNETIIPSDSDRVRAVSELSKIEGWLSATKIDAKVLSLTEGLTVLKLEEITKKK